MEKQTKLAAAKQRLAAHLPLYRCPVCHRSFQSGASGELICANGHQFDMAKPGYIHLLTRGNKTKYDQALFAARHLVAEAGFFQGLTDRLAAILEALPHEVILDAGSGEGSQLAALHGALGKAPVSIGADIAKEGIKQAARDFPGILWTVADLASSPFASGKIAVILNILSPSNYQEFKRLLMPGGYLIKVVPEVNYLQELRRSKAEQTTYSNQQVLDRFEEAFTLVASERLTYTAVLPEERVPDLLAMTPLGWHLTEKEQQQLTRQTAYTVDYRILVGKTAD